MKETKRMLRGTVILTIAAFIVKVLSAVYRVPFQNIVGDEGFYVYQQVYPIYGIGMTFALSGFPVFLSKLLAEKEGTETESEVLRTFASFLWIISFGIAFLLIVGSRLLALAMGDIGLTPLIKMTGVFFLFIPQLTLYRGIFQSQLWMTPTAVSQLGEQVVRVVIILLAAFGFATFHWDLYKMGTIAMSGAVFGGITAYFILWFYQSKAPISSKFHLLIKDEKTEKKHLNFKLPNKAFVYRCLLEGGLICAYSALLVLFQLVDSFTVKKALLNYGMTESQARIAKGVFDRGQPLAQLGLVASLALASTFLPVLTKYFVKKEEKRYQQYAVFFLKITIFISASATVGLLFLLPYVNISLFSDNQQIVALSLFIISIFFVSIIYCYQNLYQSLGKRRILVNAVVLGFLVKVGTTTIMTTYFGVVGTSLSTLGSLAVCLGILSFHAPKYLYQNLYRQHFLAKLILVLGEMGLILTGYRLVINQYFQLETVHRSIAFFIAILGVFIGGIALFCGIIQCGMFSRAEWQQLPFGKKIAKLSKVKDDKGDI